MPRRKKPRPEMTDRELLESLFPKPIRVRIEREIELDTDPEEPEIIDKLRDKPSITKKDR